jgi:nucleoside-diphosphate-sugar epimerase
MKLLIVGGSGFIGQNLCAKFIKNNIKIDILTRSLNNRKSSNNLVNFINELNCKLI